MPGQDQHGAGNRVRGHGRPRLGERRRVVDRGQPASRPPGEGREQQHRRRHQPGGCRPHPPRRQGGQHPLDPEPEADRLGQGQRGDELLAVADQPAPRNLGHHQLGQPPQPGQGRGRGHHQPGPGGHQQADRRPRRPAPSEQRPPGHGHGQHHRQPGQPRPGPDPGRHGQRVPDAPEPDQAAHRSQRPIRPRRERLRPRWPDRHPSGSQQARDQPRRIHHQGHPAHQGRPGRCPPLGGLQPGSPLSGPPEGERSRPAGAVPGFVHSPPAGPGPRPWGGGGDAEGDQRRQQAAGGAAGGGHGQGEDQLGDRVLLPGPEVEGGARCPGKGGVGDQEAPVAHEQALVDERVPGVEHGRGGPGRRRPGGDQAGGPGGGAGEHPGEDELLDQVGRDQPAGQGDQEVGRDRPGHGGVEAEQATGQLQPGHEHHVVGEHVPPPQQRAEGEQGEHPAGRQPDPPPDPAGGAGTTRRRGHGIPRLAASRPAGDQTAPAGRLSPRAMRRPSGERRRTRPAATAISPRRRAVKGRMVPRRRRRLAPLAASSAFASTVASS